MGSGTLCSDLAVGTHSAPGTALFLPFTVCFLCRAPVRIPRQSPGAHPGDQRQAVTVRWHCELAGTTGIVTSPQGRKKAQSYSSCSLLVGLQQRWSNDIPPTACGDLMLFESQSRSLLKRVQGGTTQDTTQALGLQLYLQAVKFKDCWSAARIYCPSAGEEIPSLSAQLLRLCLWEKFASVVSGFSETLEHTPLP